MEPRMVGREGVIEHLAREISYTGLAAGSIILTLEGEMPVGALTAGDRVITRDSGMATIRAIRIKEVLCDTVSIMAGSLGHTRPERDVKVPADQRVLIRDWRADALTGQKQALIPARQLVDGEFVRLEQNVAITVYEIELDRAHVIYADGLEVISHITAEELAQAA